QRRLYDYDDMILQAIAGLQAHPDLKYSLQERYQYVLLDEFQDTNQAQLKLVELLTDNPVNEGRPNVLGVGDDDQAIFAFQGADYSHMLAFYKQYRDVLVVPLTQNYRSETAILQLASQVAEQIETRLHHSFSDINKTLTAAGQNLTGQATVARHEFKSDVAQFAWVSRQIKERMDAGQSANQIAVLVPQHKYLEPLVPYLQQAGIPVRYEKRENVLDFPVIIQLIQMVKLCLALNQQNYFLADSLWPEVLSYSFWQLKTEDIWQLSWQAHDQKLSWTQLLMNNAALAPIAGFFIGLGLDLSTVNLEVLLDHIIGTRVFKNYQSPFFAYHFGNDKQRSTSFWSLLSNLTVLRQQLREYRQGDNQPLSAQDLIDFVDAHRQADIKILNTSPYNQAAQSVELMTAYKAKGREFETVFVLACSNEAWGANGRSGQAIALPQNLLPIRYGGATQDERLRLFFVAVSRAKSQLLMTSFVTNYAGRTFNRLKYLGEYQDESGNIISPLLPEVSQQVIQDDSTPPAVAELAAYWQQRHSEAVISQSGEEPSRLVDLLAPRLERFRLSASNLGRFSDTVYGGPQSLLFDSLLRFPSAPAIEAQFGTAIHKTLEKISYYQQKHGKLPASKLFLGWLQDQIDKCRLQPAQAKLLQERGQTCLESYLALAGDNFVASDRPEVNFADEGVLVGQAHLTGRIDKLEVDKQAKTVRIIDYKTGRGHAKWAKNDSKLYKYRQQLYFYKMLVEGSHSFAGYTVTGGSLVFVEANDDGQIDELQLDFDDKEMMRAKQLVEVVWQHIIGCDFPDISGYSANLQGIRQLEQDLLDGNI
ncbi:MAG: ATP-dependent DNA helicase, partial [Candidatus Saccharimonadales bacterium]